MVSNELETPKKRKKITIRNIYKKEKIKKIEKKYKKKRNNNIWCWQIWKEEDNNWLKKKIWIKRKNKCIKKTKENKVSKSIKIKGKKSTKKSKAEIMEEYLQKKINKGWSKKHSI